MSRDYVDLLYGLGLRTGPYPKITRASPWGIEGGNVYRVERRGKDGGLSGVQARVRLLHDALADRLGNESADIMKSTLAVHFCPFRVRRRSCL
jgi:hypothetical protein